MTQESCLEQIYSFLQRVSIFKRVLRFAQKTSLRPEIALADKFHLFSFERSMHSP